MKFRVPSMGSHTNVGLHVSFCFPPDVSSPRKRTPGKRDASRDSTMFSMALSRGALALGNRVFETNAHLSQ
jgi:hypothetical protein